MWQLSNLKNFLISFNVALINAYYVFSYTCTVFLLVRRGDFKYFSGCDEVLSRTCILAFDSPIYLSKNASAYETVAFWQSKLHKNFGIFVLLWIVFYIWLKVIWRKLRGEFCLFDIKKKGVLFNLCLRLLFLFEFFSFYFVKNALTVYRIALFYFLARS